MIFPVFALFAALSAPAFAQSESLAGVQAQIRRYGCNLPQYAKSVPGCRRLHAQARALASGGRTVPRASPSRPASRPAYRSAYRSPYSSPANRRKPPPPSFGGGLFGGLFAPPRSYRTRPMNRDYNYSPAPSYSAGYRTMCVRMCDGYYWPISTSTVRSRFEADALRCESSCKAPAKLFYARGIASPADYMVDLEGQPYAQLPNAFRYREEYVSDCRCKPDPWSEEAKAEYEQRAVAEASGQAPGGETMPLAGNEAVAPRPLPRANRRITRKPRRSFDSFFPFGRWSSGG